MKTFYSILYCTIRPNVGERISIGLFMANEQKCIFHFSNEKLQIIKDLYDDQAFSLIKVTLKSLTNLSTQCDTDNLNVYKGKSVLKEQYFNYLSRYANNLVTYSEPTVIDVDLNNSVFNKLFEKFIYQLSTPIIPKLRSIEKIRKRLSKSIAPYVNFDVEFDSNDIPGLLVPARIWFVGKNEVQVTGEAKDFNGIPQIVQQQINAHLFLIEQIRKTKDGKNGHFFFIGDEPSKELEENHKLWQAVRGSKIYDLVPTKEVEKIEEYMISHGVEPIYPS